MVNIFPDTMINSALLSDLYEEWAEAEDIPFQIPRLCAHCQRFIRGRQYEYKGKYYDAYCWQFRYVVDPGPQEDPTSSVRKDGTHPKRFRAL